MSGPAAFVVIGVGGPMVVGGGVIVGLEGAAAGVAVEVGAGEVGVVVWGAGVPVCGVGVAARGAAVVRWASAQAPKVRTTSTEITNFIRSASLNRTELVLSFLKVSNP